MPRGPVGLLALLLAASAPSWGQDERGRTDLTPASVERYEKALAKAAPSVVAVVVSHRKYPDPAAGPSQLGRYRPPPRNRTGDPKLDLTDPESWPDNLTGSGLVVDAAAGLVLTAYHLIEGATKVYVRTAAGTGSYADIHAADARSDLAVLKLLDPPGDLVAARFANVRTYEGPNGERPTVRQLTPLIAVGHKPSGVLSGGPPTALPVWVGNVGLSVPGQSGVREESRNRALYHYGVLIETSAAGGLGTSGGGLFNLDGELVGMSATLAAAAAGGYAIPFDHSYRRIVDVLKAGREVEYGFLGVTLGGRFGDGGRVTLTGVTPYSPAAAAGLEAGDTITSIDGKPVFRQDDLFLHIAAALADTPVRITYLRNNPFRGGGTRATTATLDKSPHSFPWIASVRPAPAFGLRVEYSSVMQAEQGSGARGLSPGVMIRELVPGSPAEARFKQLGGDQPARWLITAVDGTLTPKPSAFYAATAGKKSFTLSLIDPASDKPSQLTLPGQ